MQVLEGLEEQRLECSQQETVARGVDDRPSAGKPFCPQIGVGKFF